MLKRSAGIGPVIVTLLLLAGIAIDALPGSAPADAAPFHQRVKQVCSTMPATLGEWNMVEEREPPPAAVALLKPNVLRQRRFENSVSRRSATLLLVQCGDARDMQGHYPPNCYPGQGWTQSARRPMDWQAGDRSVSGMEYEFTRTEAGRTVSCAVCDLMILPDGRYVQNIKDISRAAANRTRQFYGAAQIQIVLDGAIPASERHEIVSTLLAGHRAVLDVLGSAGTK